MSIFAWIVIAGLIFVSGFAGGIKWHAGQDAIKENERLEQVERQRRFNEKNIDVAAEGHEKDKVRIEEKFTVLTKEVERVVEKPVYRDMCLDDDGLRVLRSAIGPAQAASQPASTVSGPSAADQR